MSAVISQSKTRPATGVIVTVSEDRMTACVAIDPLVAPQGVDGIVVLTVLEERGVVASDELAMKWGMGSVKVTTPKGPMEVAWGTKPTPGEAERLVLKVDAGRLSSEGTSPTVQVGEVVAEVGPETAGVDGTDVTGKPVAARPNPRRWSLGRGLEQDGAVVRATVSGRLSQREDGELRVLPLVELPDGAGTGLGEVYGDVVVKGTMGGASGRTLEVAGSLVVLSAMEGVKARCEEDMLVAGGVLGREASELTAGGELRCRFATAAELTAGGAVSVTADVLHCRVTSRGRIRVGGKVQGSTLVATGGVECASLLCLNKRPTIVHAGYSKELEEMAKDVLPAVEVPLQKLEQARYLLAPLRSREAVLTPAQKQQYAKLQMEASRLERQVEQLTAELKGMYDRVSGTARAEVEVTGTVGDGVTIRFPGVELTVAKPLRGPLRLTPDLTGKEPRVTCTNLTTGESESLSARYVHDVAWMQMRKVFSKAA